MNHLIAIFKDKAGKQCTLFQKDHYSYELTSMQDAQGKFKTLETFPDKSYERVKAELEKLGYKAMRKFTEGRSLSGSEALFGFCGWLTTQKDKTVMSATDDAAAIVPKITKFMRINKLKEPREGWDKILKHPKGDVTEMKLIRELLQLTEGLESKIDVLLKDTEGLESKFQYWWADGKCWFERVADAKEALEIINDAGYNAKLVASGDARQPEASCRIEFGPVRK